jgi:hypothetical protein
LFSLPAADYLITIGIPEFNSVGQHGFSVQFFNKISSIRYDAADGTNFTEEIL